MDGLRLGRLALHPLDDFDDDDLLELPPESPPLMPSNSSMLSSSCARRVAAGLGWSVVEESVWCDVCSGMVASFALR